MTNTRVVNIRKSPYEVYIGRGSLFGNPFVIGKDGTREEVIDKYCEWFHKELKDDFFAQQVRDLSGKTLGCYCKPEACHGDIIVQHIDRIVFAEKWKNQKVRLRGTFYELPDKEYVVTAALYKWDSGDVTVFAIMAVDYTLENKHWFTIKIAPDDFEKCMGDFEIVD